MGCGLELTDGKDESKKIKVTTCREWFNYKDKGFYSYTTADMTMESWFIRDCNTLRFLKKSIPSKVSYLSDFILSEDAIKYLPANLIEWGCVGSEEECNKIYGKTIEDLGPGLKVKVEDNFNLKLEYDGTANSLTLLAWGDFTHDGVEDILLSVTHHYIEGTGRGYESVVLTRLKKNGKLVKIPIDE